MKQQKQSPLEDQKEKNLLEEQEVLEWKNKYLRALADYQNLVKRSEAEKEEMRLYAVEQLLKKLLPIVDNLERAQKHTENEGVALVLKELFFVLTQYGVKPIDVVGKEFNPEYMECIEVVKGKKDVVIACIEPGYQMHEKLLRAAKVQVGGGE